MTVPTASSGSSVPSWSALSSRWRWRSRSRPRPIGPVRPVYPTPGLSADWTVLGLGLLVLICRPRCHAAGVSAYRAVPRGGDDRSPPHPQALGRWPDGGGVARASRRRPSPGCVSPSSRAPGRNAVPVRSAILGRGPRRHRRGHHGHVLGQPQRPRVAPAPVGLELGLDPGGGREVGEHPRSQPPEPARPRPVRGVVVGRLRLRPPHRRAGHAGARRAPRGLGAAARAVRARAHRARADRARGHHLGPICTSTSARP